MNFLTAVQSLVDPEVEFMIIGGWSAILHGSAYTTNDLDIRYSRNPRNRESSFRRWPPYTRPPAGSVVY